MNLSQLAIKRPIFITCLVILLLTVGYMSLRKLPVNLFPNVTFPVIIIHTSYPGASPEEIETSVSKIVEDEMNNIPGIKQIRSDNTEGRSQVIIEFTSDTDIKYAEQQVRDRINTVKRKLPSEIEEPVIKRIDPADQPILILALKSNLPAPQLFDVADNTIKPRLEQINQVGMVEILGGTQREIHVDLNRDKLLQRGISATQVANRIATGGQNVPIGKIDQGMTEKIFRSLGEYHSLQDVGSVVVNFLGSDKPITVSDVGSIVTGIKDKASKTYVNGRQSLLLMVYRQTGTNTIEVAKKVQKQLRLLNTDFQTKKLPVSIEVVRDGSKMIKANVDDVVESMLIGILLTIIVVYLFLGSIRSTIITGLALPTSVIGSFLLMHLAGFSINTMSLLALSLAVGLLVDDAIVVRENIFRHGEMGKTRRQAAIEGTQEVLLAVIATTLTVIAVFGPIGFLHGIVGGFFKEFGLTICFAMAISLFDALTIAPMLSAYVGLGKKSQRPNSLIACFNRLQLKTEHGYEKLLRIVIRKPLRFLITALIIFIVSIFATKYVPKTFVPAQDQGEFLISLELPPGANLHATDLLTQKVYLALKSHPEIASAVAIVGNHGEPNRVQFFINMVPSKERHVNTTNFKALMRKELQAFHGVKIVVKDIDLVGGGQRPFNLNLTGDNLEELKATAFKVYEMLRNNKGLVDPEISYKSGKPEMQVVPDKQKVQQLGVNLSSLGQELRTQIEGTVPAVFRDNSHEYDIRVRLQEDQRDLEKGFNNTYIPNINSNLIRLSDMAHPVHAFSPVSISRKDRGRYIQISADIAPNGPGMGGVMNGINELFATHYKLPSGISYAFEGQAESFQELIENMIIAITLGILFVYLVLASLYESFITPFTIMLVLPLAACGAFYGLLITQHSLDIFSMIGCILLFGIATKNSILLVDYTRQLTAEGMALTEAIVKAGTTRLRPILMTTIALIAGMLPIAIGLNEASKQRTSMGIAIIGGLISSTVLTLVVVPAAYAYIERFKKWFAGKILRHSRTEGAAESSLILPE